MTLCEVVMDSATNLASSEATTLVTSSSSESNFSGHCPWQGEQESETILVVLLCCALVKQLRHEQDEFCRPIPHSMVGDSDQDMHRLLTLENDRA